MDTTLPNDRSTAHGGRTAVPAECWSLTVAHHRHPEYLGRRAVIFDGTQIQLGRTQRSLGADVFDDGRISREHALVAADDESALWISDGGSRNGTFVNGRRIEKCELSRGDVIGIGDMLLVAQRGPPLVRAVEGGELVGVSHAFAEVCERIDKVAERDTTVVFIGEPGSGKTALARRLHRKSGRTGAFMSVHCGSLPDELLHSELFGHVAGAFPSAGTDRRGLIDAASDGTLLFEGVEVASPKLQLALIQFLDERRIRKLGADEARHVDVRVAVSCERDPELLGDTGALRRELVDRLGSWRIPVPPLASRVEDIGVLSLCFVRKYAGDEAVLDRRLALHLMRRSWPGNVRELEAFIEQVVIESGGATIRLPARLGAGASGGAGTPEVVDVARDASWFRLAGQERVDLRKRKALRRILAALLDQRRHDPGSSMSVADLLSAGWPGEHPSAESGANRVYVALTALRRLGLRDVVERNKAGYVIPPEAAIRERSSDSDPA